MEPEVIVPRCFSLLLSHHKSLSLPTESITMSGNLVVQSLSHVRFSVSPRTAARQAPVSTISWSLLKLISIESVMPSNHLILCCPLLLLPSILPSIRVFSNSSSHQVAKVLEIQLQHQSFNDYSGPISFRMNWFELLAVQGTLKSFI